MQAFEYASPKTTSEAVKLLASMWGESEVLAGGTDLVSAMKDNVATPRRVVSLAGIKSRIPAPACASALRRPFRS